MGRVAGSPPMASERKPAWGLGLGDQREAHAHLQVWPAMGMGAAPCLVGQLAAIGPGQAADGWGSRQAFVRCCARHLTFEGLTPASLGKAVPPEAQY